MTTPTPRTDAAAFVTEEGDYWRTVEGLHEIVSADFARQLERDLAAARAELAQVQSDFFILANPTSYHRFYDLWVKKQEEIAAAKEKAERAEARAEANAKDAERYRWLRDESWKGINGTFAARWCLVANRGAGLDAAIDAIAEGKK